MWEVGYFVGHSNIAQRTAASGQALHFVGDMSALELQGQLEPVVLLSLHATT